MLPAQRKKIDISSMTEEEQKLFRLYGKLPTHKNVITKMQKDRKYFDSGDYALSKAGKAPQNTVGTAIPSPENIPHASTPNVNQQSGGLSSSPTNGITSPIKESGLSHFDVKPNETQSNPAALSEAAPTFVATSVPTLTLPTPAHAPAPAPAPAPAAAAEDDDDEEEEEEDEEDDE